MSTTNTQCPEVLMTGNCTKGEDCEYCKANLEINFNVNAKGYVPKGKRTQDGNQINEKLNLNLNANEYTPKLAEPEEEEEEDDDLEPEEFDQIMKDIINNEVMEELEEDESDDEKWFPKFRDCECCKGFVYKCNGTACANLGACYCKMKEECDDEDGL